MRAVVLSGHREFRDPWHDLAATSDQLADILKRDGFLVEIRDDVADTLARVPVTDLLVVNCSGPAASEETAAELASDAVLGLRGYLSSGRGLLAMHSTVMAFPDWPGWGELLGARWRAPESMHPPRGPAYIRVRAGAHPIVEGISHFVADDERYSHLELCAPFVTLAEHRHAERIHPLIWARTEGPARVVYDGLGHDVTAYANPVHRELVRRAARWVAGR